MRHDASQSSVGLLELMGDRMIVFSFQLTQRVPEQNRASHNGHGRKNRVNEEPSEKSHKCGTKTRALEGSYELLIGTK